MGKVLSNIMASLAQQKSESLCAKVQPGIPLRNQNGKERIDHNRCLDNMMDTEGRLVNILVEVEIVRHICREYIEGASFITYSEGIRSKWYQKQRGQS